MQNKLPSFSLWCDFIERNFIDEDFTKFIENSYINGATSNPAIFKTAFLNSNAYKEDKKNLKGKNPKEIYETLAIKDINLAANKLMSLYLAKNDGFISIEVDPFLEQDSQATIKEGKRLYSAIGMPNVMIKIPATKEGYKAMQELIAKGINVNATLIFSPEQAKHCLESFEAGTKVFIEKFPEAQRLPEAVISVFVSRFDKKLEKDLEKHKQNTAKFGIYNASLIYKNIEKKGLKNVRCLFASTGVKSDKLKKDYYITELLYPNSINTAPIDAFEEFIKNNSPKFKEIPSDKELKEYFDSIKNLNINIEKVYEELIDEGIKAFHEAFKDILDSLK